MHVADGWAARNSRQLNLAESEEMAEDRAYLARRTAELQAEGFEVESCWRSANPPMRSSASPVELAVDLIAMSTHGHRFIGDLVYGSTADKVRHLVDIPVLLLKARK